MTIDFHALRTKMVDGQLRTTDVTDTAVLDAMAGVPREKFVPARRRELAYIDEDIEVAMASAGRTARYIMEPSPFARLIQLAGIRASDLVLDVGCTTGYSAAVLSRIASFVVAVESDPALVEAANSNLTALGYENVAVVEAPLAEGHAAQAPYDVIVIEGAVDFVPEALLDQLKDGGRLVAVVGRGNAASAMVYQKDGGVVSARRTFNAAVAGLDDFKREPAFQF